MYLWKQCSNCKGERMLSRSALSKRVCPDCGGSGFAADRISSDKGRGAWSLGHVYMMDARERPVIQFDRP